MAPTAAVWLVILAAVVAANLPFLTQRLVLFIRLAAPKSLGLRLLELVLYYFLVGGLGLLLERNLGRIAPQGWEFYAITAALFVTLAFPGFVWRYLVKHRH
ncbi:DUF2818 family protein [Pseudorhodoferax sp. Leaf267]|uniref:DUF2818 family protein n=1 Tax=Pseudorhodoferax sp. Leaf267 TaxID=1736316 RepID=UPI0006FD8BFF|nr:DUF2818 family protein [Pseudorhodoferax sp. Leaf267]KQP22507.1 hypothetical protein ASF43_00845 [Pseudorhodoferax sp. Leaf267]